MGLYKEIMDIQKATDERISELLKRKNEEKVPIRQIKAKQKEATDNIKQLFEDRRKDDGFLDEAINGKTTYLDLVQQIQCMYDSSSLKKMLPPDDPSYQRKITYLEEALDMDEYKGYRSLTRTAKRKEMIQSGLQSSAIGGVVTGLMSLTKKISPKYAVIVGSIIGAASEAVSVASDIKRVDKSISYLENRAKLMQRKIESVYKKK